MDIAPSVDLQSLAQDLVRATRNIVFIRPEDGLIILRPNRLHHLNETALFMLDRLYNRPEVDVEGLIDEVTQRYGVDRDRVRSDLVGLLRSLNGVLSDDWRQVTAVRTMPFGSHKRELPVLSEIALTYRCQNRCTFCYADAPRRARAMTEMTTSEVKTVIDRIAHEAHCPTLSFTGGEPTLREDLPELIAHGHAQGLRVNLITNGLRCADEVYAAALAAAGLESAQVSLEGGSAQVHDAITQHPGSWERTVCAVRALRKAGVFTHTNTTICGGNRGHLMELVDFVADQLGSAYLSMNMVIRTGTALDHAEDDITYSSIGATVATLQEHAHGKGLKLVWYSPVPYCMFNPVQAGLGSKACACVDGLISVNPAGELLPCSSFERGIGDLLRRPFDKVWFSRTARYWRNKEFIPPLCQRCDIRDICCGACPLYWDERGSFVELEGRAPGGPLWAMPLWRAKKALWSQTWGVGLRRRPRKEV